VTYSSYPTAYPPDATYGLFFGGFADGMDAPCTNPAALAGGKAHATGVHFPTLAEATLAGTIRDLKADLGVETDDAVYRDFYSLECTQNDEGRSYLAVTLEQSDGDARVDPLLYDAPELFVALAGLHVYDFQIAIDDLLALVRAHAD
jgi:hypothetical protein